MTKTHELKIAPEEERNLEHIFTGYTQEEIDKMANALKEENK
ncbi:hypothetical protein ACK2EA_000033 [Listeria monocytogenes]